MTHPASKCNRIPLVRALSKLGIASRTQGEAMILAGRVRVGGVVRRDPGILLVPESTSIEIDGVSVERAQWRTLLMYKPRSVVTTRSDEKGRPTVFSLLGEKGLGLHAVGRLDWATTGLLLLTNDTRLSSWLTDPENAVPRVYIVTVRGLLTGEKVQRLERGIRDEDELLRAEKVTLRKASGKESHLTVELTEGRNREIRRLFKAIGHEVTRLKRVAFGGLALGALAPGEHRDLTREELLAAFNGLPLGR